jgi:arylsulfatase A-like enzyme
MMKHRTGLLSKAVLAALLVSGGAFAAETGDKPNVLLIYLDDMGWGQLGCYGGKLAETPNIDALAARGVRFTNGYVSAPVCSPSRVGLLTGRYQARTGHDGLTAKPGSELDIHETTIAQRMKNAGYVTGIVGKWHVGDGPEFLPASRGFDYSFGSTGNVNEGQDGSRFYRGTELIADPPGAPVTAPLYRNEALKFIVANQKKPWILNLAMNSVHTPVVASEAMLERFAALDKNAGAYAAMIAEADESIGAVLGKLRQLKLAENTLVFLISDNGGASPLAEMGGLHGHKWLTWEGGIRVAWIAVWEAHVPGGRVLDEPVIQLDVLPTVLAAAGAPVKPEWNLDGANLLPLLEGKVDRLEPRTLYWRFGVQYAVRQGDWKVVKAAIDMPPMLVNLAKDPGEQIDLAAAHPEKMAELQVLWDKWNDAMRPPRWDDARWNGEEAMKKLRAGRKNREQDSK